MGVAILIGLDHLEAAAVFDGVASTILTPKYRASAADWTNLQAAIASARAAHGPDRYDGAFQAGTRMTYDQAVEHALRVLEEVIEETTRAEPAPSH